MEIPENPNNNDIRDALIQLRQGIESRFDAVDKKFDAVDKKFDAVDKKFDEVELRFGQLDQKLEKLDYKFETYQKGTDGMVRMATTIIIATASVVVLSSLTPAITAIVTALSNQ